jgi:hypothetical protein
MSKVSKKSLEFLRGYVPQSAPFDPKVFETRNLKKIVFPRRAKMSKKITKNAEEVAGVVPQSAPFDPKFSTTGITPRNVKTKKEEVDSQIALKTALRNDITTLQQGESMAIERKQKNYAPIIESLNQLGLTQTISQTFMPEQVAKTIIDKISEFGQGITADEFNKALPDLMKQIAGDLKQQIINGTLMPVDIPKIISAVRSGPAPSVAPLVVSSLLADSKKILFDSIMADLAAFDGVSFAAKYLIPLADIGRFAAAKSEDEQKAMATLYINNISAIVSTYMSASLDAATPGEIKKTIQTLKNLGEYAVGESLAAINAQLEKRGYPKLLPDLSNVDSIVLPVSALEGKIRAALSTGSSAALEAILVPRVDAVLFAEAEPGEHDKITETYLTKIVNYAVTLIISSIDALNVKAAEDYINKLVALGDPSLTEEVSRRVNKWMDDVGHDLFESDFSNRASVLASAKELPWVKYPTVDNPWLLLTGVPNQIQILDNKFNLARMKDPGKASMSSTVKGKFAFNNGIDIGLFAFLALALARRRSPKVFLEAVKTLGPQPKQDIKKLLEIIKSDYENSASKDELANRNPDVAKMLDNLSDEMIGLGIDDSRRMAVSLGRPPILAYGIDARADNSDEEFNAKSYLLDVALKRGMITEDEYIRRQKAL